jgi:alcohol dehydrogenase
LKAAVLNAFGSPLDLQTLPDPVLGTGEVIVDVAATRVLSYAGDVFSGARGYLLELPIAPGTGAIGQVRAVGPDATRLAVGDWVYCDPTVRSRDDVLSPDIILQGLTAGGEAALPLQRYFRHGAFAKQMLIPTENATRIGEIDAADAARWCALGTLLVPYGGLAAGELRAGETVLVSGATGSFGSAGVAVALAMGAACVVMTGRNAEILAQLAERFGPRVRPVRMSGDEDEDRARIQGAAAGPIDLVLDLLPPMASATQARAAAMALRPHGRVVLMGGVRDDLSLPYAWMMRNGITVRGQWMYGREAPIRMTAMIRAGLVDLAGFEVTAFGLDAANDAVRHAAENAGPFKMTVVRHGA